VGARGAQRTRPRGPSGSSSRDSRYRPTASISLVSGSIVRESRAGLRARPRPIDRPPRRTRSSPVPSPGSIWILATTSFEAGSIRTSSPPSSPLPVTQTALAVASTQWGVTRPRSTGSITRSASRSMRDRVPAYVFVTQRESPPRSRSKALSSEISSVTCLWLDPHGGLHLWSRPTELRRRPRVDAATVADLHRPHDEAPSRFGLL
jgi:hypothetical protein